MNLFAQLLVCSPEQVTIQFYSETEPSLSEDEYKHRSTKTLPTVINPRGPECLLIDNN